MAPTSAPRPWGRAPVGPPGRCRPSALPLPFRGAAAAPLNLPGTQFGKWRAGKMEARRGVAGRGAVVEVHGHYRVTFAKQVSAVTGRGRAGAGAGRKGRGWLPRGPLCGSPTGPSRILSARLARGRPAGKRHFHRCDSWAGLPENGPAPRAAASRFYPILQSTSAAHLRSHSAFRPGFPLQPFLCSDASPLYEPALDDAALTFRSFRSVRPSVLPCAPPPRRSGTAPEGRRKADITLDECGSRAAPMTLVVAAALIGGLDASRAFGGGARWCRRGVLSVAVSSAAGFPLQSGRRVKCRYPAPRCAALCCACRGDTPPTLRRNVIATFTTARAAVLRGLSLQVQVERVFFHIQAF